MKYSIDAEGNTKPETACDLVRKDQCPVCTWRGLLEFHTGKFG